MVEPDGLSFIKCCILMLECDNKKIKAGLFSYNQIIRGKTDYWIVIIWHINYYNLVIIRHVYFILQIII
jgi:hypothetical protein